MTSPTRSQSPEDTKDETASVGHNTGAWITRWAEQRPEALAWADSERRCDYAEAKDRIDRLVDWLIRNGVSRGDRVALWLGNRGPMLEALFAAARLGAIVLPVNARLTATEVAFQFDDATPSVALIERAWRDRARDALELMQEPPPQLLEVGATERAGGVDPDGDHCDGSDLQDAYAEALANAKPSSICEAVHPDDPMILMYTSGTTGHPKGALLPHRKTLYNCRNAEIFFGIDASDRVLVVAPLFHSLGLQILALPALYAGAGVILQEGFDPERVWSAIEQESVTYYGGVPTMHQRLLDALEKRSPAGLPETLRFAFTAGAAAPATLVEAFGEKGLRLTQGYGQTETSTLTCQPPDSPLSNAGSVGQPVRHAELRLVDPNTIDEDVEHWRDVAPGDVGEIVVRGPITMLGYWRRPEATAQTLRGEWLRTGDLATRDRDFNITLVGRGREMYISGGENVYPAEVEAALSNHSNIAEVAIVPIPDAEWGEVGRAHIVPVDSHAIDTEALLNWLGERLARFKLPREVVIETVLPRTASGKIQKHRLGEQAASGQDHSEERLPRKPTQRTTSK
jgi:fatty-acyl-CoA synthase